MLESDKPLRMPDYRLEQMDGEILLYHPGSTQAMYLNASASLIWQLCDGEHTVAEIRNLLQGAYPDGGDRVAQDLDTVLEHFIAQGMAQLR